MNAVVQHAHPERMVLVADDDATARALACAALEEAGFATVEARDGVEAIAAWRAHRPDLVLLDVDMPALTGFEVCTEIRGLGSNVPIVIVTGFEDTASIDRAFEVGATDFIAKPVNWPLLGHRVRYVLRGADTNLALVSSEAQNRALLEAFPDRLLIVNERGEVEQFIGRRDLRGNADEGLAMSQVLPAQAMRQALQSVRNVLATVVDESLEFAEEDSEGITRHFETRFIHHGDQRVLVIVRDVSERKATEARIQRLAYYDSLTALANRHLLMEQLSSSLQNAERGDSTLAVFYVDIDQFKRINDSLGLRAGDEVLRIVAQRLSVCIAGYRQHNQRNDSSTDALIARLGADEFAAFAAPMANVAEAEALAAKLQEKLAKPLRYENQEMVITLSIGYSLFPRDGHDAVTLLRNASAAMQKAKELGRNSVREYSPAMNEQALERLAIESELRRALSNGDLQIYYQPKFDISSLDIVGAECLLRWPHPQRGMISPAVFIAIAEETGLIADIDRWVTRNACAQLAQWRREGQPLVPLSINLSGREFWDASFLSVLRSEADAAGIEPALLEIEITEGVLMRDAQLAKSTLASLKNEGFGLSVDDFGTGFSSLSYLKQFPLDSLKIDRSFVMELETKPENQAICRAIIAMAHSLGLKVIAEGVETDAQLAFLSREECDVAQGYLLGRPMKLEQFATLVAHDVRRRHTLRAPLAAKPRNQPSIQP